MKVMELPWSGGLLVHADHVSKTQAQWVVGLLYQLSLAAAKISILLLYIRVLKHQYACWAAWGMLVVVVGYNIFGLVEDFIICAPLAAYWDPSVGSCQPPGSVMWALICLHIATDFLIFLIPLPVVFRMKLPLKQKIGLSLTFALGFLYEAFLYLSPAFHVLAATGANSDLPQRLLHIHPPGHLHLAALRLQRFHLGLQCHLRLDVGGDQHRHHRSLLDRAEAPGEEAFPKILHGRSQPHWSVCQCQEPRPVAFASGGAGIWS